MTVADLVYGQQAHITELIGEAGLEEKLREIGFCEGDTVELVARGPLNGQPLAVRLNRRIIALRREEAAALRVKLAHD